MQEKHEFLPGHRIGYYTIIKKMTAGTFGTLYLAEEETLGCIVVLKVVSISPAFQETQLGQDVFSLGSRLTTLSHPAILPTLEVQLEHSPPYVITCCATGGTLGHHLTAVFPRGLSDAGTIIQSIGRALEYLHAQKILHRGVQPGCLLFDYAGNIRLSGFDLAVETAHLRSPSYVRTASYHAPEQEHGEVSVLSDQYSLARVAYQVLTGRPPSQQSHAHLSQCMMRGEIPAPLGRAILRALNESPSLRWPSIAAFLEACDLLR